MAEARDNSGVIFRNERREKETHPTHTGSCTVNGVEMWISAWVKDGAKGKFFSLAFKPKEARAEPPKKSSFKDDMDDEIPF